MILIGLIELFRGAPVRNVCKGSAESTEIVAPLHSRSNGEQRAKKRQHGRNDQPKSMMRA